MKITQNEVTTMDLPNSTTKLLRCASNYQKDWLVNKFSCSGGM